MPTVESTVVECRNVKKSWGGVHALAGVSLAVRGAEIVGLAGANGAGKTTLLNAIGGQTRLNHGEVLFRGRRIDRLSPIAIRRLGLARTFQATRILSTRTVIENVAMSAEYCKPKRRLPPVRFGSSTFSVAREALAFVGLSGVEAAAAGELGVYAEKRLMLAMALVPEPQILLLDEPAGGLSPAEVDEMAELVRGLRERDIAILLVDHVMSFITQLADRMIVLHDGAVLAEGTSREIVRDARVRETWLGNPEPGPAA